MLRWFNDLKIGNKLIGAFLVMIGLTIIVSVIALISQTNTQTTVDNLLDVGVGIAELSLESNNAMLNARRGEKDYLLRYKELGFEEARAEYVAQVQDEADVVRQNMDKIKTLSTNTDEIDKAEEISQAITQYETTFLTTVSMIEQRGFVDAGLEGEFREKVHNIEAVVEAQNLDRLAIDMLTMRRHEKDYLLRGEEQYATEVAQAVTQFKTDVAATDLSPAEKEQMIRLADEYQAAFDKLVETDAQVAASTATYREAVHSVEEPLAEFLDNARTNQELAHNNLQSMATLAMWTVIITSVIAAVIGLVVALFLSRGIAKSVNVVARAANGIAEGDLEQSVEVKSKDELGNMAAAFQRMIVYMQQMAGAAVHLSQGDVTVDVTPQSDKDVLGRAFTQMIAYQQQMAKSANRLAMGDVTVRVSPQSERDELGNAFTQMIAYQQQMTEAASRLAQGDVTVDVTPQSDKDGLGSAFTQMIAYQQQMAKSAGLIAQGDLTVRVTPLSEKDAMGNAFGQMIFNLRHLIGQTQQSADQVADASLQLNVAAEQSSQAGQQVAATSQQLAEGTSQQTQAITESTSSVEQMARAAEGIARGAQEQAQGVQNTSNLVDEMNTIVEQVGQVADSVSKANVKVTQAARHGVSAVEQTGQGMDSIRTRTIAAAEKVKEMGNRSKEIGRIVETIDDIADKTDMLALNAAVEAARAGEHGRGFAVVADQVRKLSEDSKEATRDIGILIERVQETVNDAIAAMDSTVAEVDTGARLTGDTTQSLRDILQAAEDAAELAGRIGAAVSQLKQKSEGVVAAIETVSAVVEENTAVAEEMAANSQEVTDAMEAVASVAEENSAATEEVSASAEEMSAQIEEVVASAEELSALAETLREATARFRVDGADPAEPGPLGDGWKITNGSRRPPQATLTTAGSRQGNGHSTEAR